MIDPKDYLERARSAKGKGITYALGQGGFHPDDPKPTRTGSSDCIGYAFWIMGITRKPTKDFPVWKNTDVVWNDAKGAQKMFRRVSIPVPGQTFLVYPHIPGKGHGHIALWTGDKNVIDCSLSRKGITEHPAAYFWNRKDTLFVELIGARVQDGQQVCDGHEEDGIFAPNPPGSDEGMKEA